MRVCCGNVEVECVFSLSCSISWYNEDVVCGVTEWCNSECVCGEACFRYAGECEVVCGCCASLVVDGEGEKVGGGEVSDGECSVVLDCSNTVVEYNKCKRECCFEFGVRGCSCDVERVRSRDCCWECSYGECTVRVGEERECFVVCCSDWFRCRDGECVCFGKVCRVRYGKMIRGSFLCVNVLFLCFWNKVYVCWFGDGDGLCECFFEGACAYVCFYNVYSCRNIAGDGECLRVCGYCLCGEGSRVLLLCPVFRVACVPEGVCCRGCVSVGYSEGVVECLACLCVELWECSCLKVGHCRCGSGEGEK